jgi:hypothetical protein
VDTVPSHTPRIASLQWFGRSDGRDRMIDCIRVPAWRVVVDMARAQAKKVFGILRKFARGIARPADMVEAGFPILTLPHVRKHFHELGMAPMGISPAQFAAAIASETPLSAAPRAGGSRLARFFLHSFPFQVTINRPVRYAGSGSRTKFKSSGSGK